MCIGVIFSFYKDTSPVLPHLDLVISAKTLFQVTSHAEVLSRHEFFLSVPHGLWDLSSLTGIKPVPPHTGSAEWVDVNFGGDTVQLSGGLVTEVTPVVRQAFRKPVFPMTSIMF